MERNLSDDYRLLQAVNINSKKQLKGGFKQDEAGTDN